ncbi:MAG: N-ethylmaleimide reductase [Polaribacter sp.]|jgi:N-ethylmaleimide reductase
MKIFTKHSLGNIELKNRVVLAPMTRSRAVDNIPNEIMAKYYAMRADAGLLIPLRSFLLTAKRLDC